MKRILLIAFALSIAGTCIYAQKMGVIPSKLTTIPAVKVVTNFDPPIAPLLNQNPYVSSQTPKAGTFQSLNKMLTTETYIGNSVYDLQTNSSVQNRLVVYSDGTIGGTWTYGTTDPSFPERGTGYNYFDGTAWGAQPTARVESMRCGWPSLCPFGSNGELVVSHNGTTGLLVSTRTTKGAGAWTESTLIGPACSDGSTALLWPRVITSGNTIHIIACTNQTTTSVPITYQGLQLALLYIRSTDGGVTWDAPRILPGMDAASAVKINHKGYGGDTYAWGNPVGNTIAFAVASEWGGLFIMKSTDAGDNWTKIPVYDFPTLTSGVATPRIPSVDGSVAIALDASGNAHVCVGRMQVSDTNPSTANDSTSWYPYTDGLLYWHEGLAAWDSTYISLNNDAALYTAGTMIGHMADWDGDDSLTFPVVGTGQFPFGNYEIGLSSMPQIVINGSNIYVTYSSCREDQIGSGSNPNDQLFRHIMWTKSNDGGATWDSTVVDLNGDVNHDLVECVFASLAYQNGNMHAIYQSDYEPGLAVRGDMDGYGGNDIVYMTWPTITGINENTKPLSDMRIYPNPSHDYSYIDLTLNQAQKVDLTITNLLGQQVYKQSYGNYAAGKYTFIVNTEKYSPGIYFYNLKTGEYMITQKLIIE